MHDFGQTESLLPLDPVLHVVLPCFSVMQYRALESLKDPPTELAFPVTQPKRKTLPQFRIVEPMENNNVVETEGYENDNLVTIF